MYFEDDYRLTDMSSHGHGVSAPPPPAPPGYRVSPTRSSHRIRANSVSSNKSTSSSTISRRSDSQSSKNGSGSRARGSASSDRRNRQSHSRSSHRKSSRASRHSDQRQDFALPQRHVARGIHYSAQATVCQNVRIQGAEAQVRVALRGQSVAQAEQALAMALTLLDEVGAEALPQLCEYVQQLQDELHLWGQVQVSMESATTEAELQQVIEQAKQAGLTPTQLKAITQHIVMLDVVYQRHNDRTQSQSFLKKRLGSDGNDSAGGGR